MRTPTSALAKANAYPDVYVLYQPYTFQNNTYLGVPSAYSWTLGMTATIPLYNRNQGNITRAKINITNQTRSRRPAWSGPSSATSSTPPRSWSRASSAWEFRTEIIPAARRMRDAAYRL